VDRSTPALHKTSKYRDLTTGLHQHVQVGGVDGGGRETKQTFAAWQAKGWDDGSKVVKMPSTQQIIQMMRAMVMPS
jgi:hypothetical protein